MASKFVDAQTAAEMVGNAATVTLSGDLSLLVPEKILEALEERFLQTGEPRGLTLFTPVIVGSVAGRGMDRLSHSGMVTRVLSASYSVAGMTRMNALIEAGEVEAYALPMGTAYHLLRAIAARQPGVFTTVGLETFVDPRLGGGLIGATGSAAPVEVVQLKDQEYLFYPAFPVDVAIIRGTTADEDGNLSLENEPVSLGVAAMALAAKRGGGRVIAQVKGVKQRGALHPRLVEVPGSLVDAVVVDPDQAQRIGPDDPSLTGAARLPLELIETLALDATEDHCPARGTRAASARSPEHRLWGCGRPAPDRPRGRDRGGGHLYDRARRPGRLSHRRGQLRRPPQPPRHLRLADDVRSLQRGLFGRRLPQPRPG